MTCRYCGKSASDPTAYDPQFLNDNCSYNNIREPIADGVLRGETTRPSNPILDGRMCIDNELDIKHFDALFQVVYDNLHLNQLGYAETLQTL